MMVFTSDIGAEILSQTEKWHIDGTFKKRPKLFYQILTIWALYNDELIACAYSVLPNKLTSTYLSLFEVIKNICNQNGELKLKTVLTDFETALQNALKLVFEDVEVKDCWFHFNQAIMRKLFSLGTRYKFY